MKQHRLTPLATCRLSLLSFKSRRARTSTVCPEREHSSGTDTPIPRPRRLSAASRHLAWLLLVALFFPLELGAQSVGSITGIVTDPSGAVVANARVVATRVETGVAQSTLSSKAGTYTIPNLVVGTYDVTADVSGFKVATAKGITLDVSQQRQVDFKLSLLGVESTVEVSTAPPLVNKTLQDGSYGHSCVQSALRGLNVLGSGNQSPVGAAINQL